MVWFWNQLATRITAKHPDAWLTVYTYSVYNAPPMREKLHPNLAVGFVQMNYRSDAARKQALEGTPAIYAHKLGEDLNNFAHYSLIGTGFDS